MEREIDNSEGMGHPMLSIIIVNWNVRELLRQCLASVFVSTVPVQCLEVIVVDNASADDSDRMVAEEFPQVKLLANSINVGFTRANNQGIAVARGKHVLLLNPDTEIIGGALLQLIDHLETNPAVGAVGPMLLNTDSTIQSSRRKFPNRRVALVESTMLQPLFADSDLLKKYFCLDVSPDIPQEVDWLVGACLLIRGEALRQVGGLDERFFMYFEEVDWCLRATKMGWKIDYLPRSQVVHHYGKSSEKDVPHRHIYFNDSKCKFFSKHFGAVTGISLRLFLLGLYLFQMLEEGLKFGIGHKRALRKERMAVYLKVLKSGLRA